MISKLNSNYYLKYFSYYIPLALSVLSRPMNVSCNIRVNKDENNQIN